MIDINEEHFCRKIDNFPLNKFFQKGSGLGKTVLILGEAPANNGWRKSGKAFYSPEGKLLASGKRLNELLEEFDLNVENCGFTELSKCFVGKNRKILKKCCKKCWPIFLRQIKGKNYKLIIILGVVTTKIMGELVGGEINMGEMKRVKISEKIRVLLPIYHPSPINPHGRDKNIKIFKKYKKEIKELIFG